MKKTLIYVALMLVGIFTSCQSKQSESATNTPVFSASSTTMTIAMVDTDSVFAQYDMVADVMKELDAVEKKLTGDLQSRAKKFEDDYQNYLKIGATLTLSEQKKKEEQLQTRQQDLQQMEQKYTQQLMEARARKNQEVQDKIFAFIEDYNKTHGNYTIIMSKARSGGVLYSLPSMDITVEILDALNEDYSKNRNK